MIEWLMSPIDPARDHSVGLMLGWHGRLMVFAWGILLPMGVVVARFFKVTPGQDWPREVENPVWWLLHRLFQYSGLVVMVVALGLTVLFDEDTPSSALHGWIGWSVAALAAIQFLAAMAHGTKGGPRNKNADGSTFGDHYNMTRRRIVFEWTHKYLGYLLIAISIGSIVTGLWTANAPGWMWAGQVLCWLMLLVAFIVLQRQGRAIDTYQAIWGTDPSHPGNQRPPIGLGIRRGVPDSSINPTSIRQRRDQRSRHW